MENKNNLNEVKGYELKPPCPCDQCVTETDDCRKLILAGGEHLCATPKDIDWEQRRYEIAREIMANCFHEDEMKGVSVEFMSLCAVEAADALIKKLKE